MTRMRSTMAALLAATALSGMASAAELRVGLRANGESMDPHYSAVGSNIGSARNVFDSLIGIDSALQPEPGLATSWQMSSPTTWVVKLKPGVNSRWLHIRSQGCRSFAGTHPQVSRTRRRTGTLRATHRQRDGHRQHDGRIQDRRAHGHSAARSDAPSHRSLGSAARCDTGRLQQRQICNRHRPVQTRVVHAARGDMVLGPMRTTGVRIALDQSDVFRNQQ